MKKFASNPLSPRSRSYNRLQTPLLLPILSNEINQWRQDMRKAIAGGAGCVMALALLSTEAEARIICNDDYQVVNGQEISTPYCNDNHVAAIARKRGMKVTDEAVRNDPSVKEGICLWIGRDHRIRHYCDQYYDTGGE